MVRVFGCWSPDSKNVFLRMNGVKLRIVQAEPVIEHA